MVGLLSHTHTSIVELHAITKEKVKLVQSFPRVIYTQWTMLWWWWWWQGWRPIVPSPSKTGGWKQWGGKPGPQGTMLKQFMISMHMCNGRDGMLQTKARFIRAPDEQWHTGQYFVPRSASARPCHCVMSSTSSDAASYLPATPNWDKQERSPAWEVRSYLPSKTPRLLQPCPPRWPTLVGDMASCWGGQTLRSDQRTE